MISAETQRSNWFSKFSLCFLAFVGAVNASLTVIIPLLPLKYANYYNTAGMSSLLGAILFAIGFSIYWNYKERKGDTNIVKYKVWFIILLRYWLAFQISVYGFEKLFEVNFAFSYHADDTLVNSLTGQQLTWKYYGFSYGLSLIIGLLQIVGSIFLLFRRTILLGIVTLLPLFVNIVLINIFYGIGPITIFTCLLISLGLCYLLFQRKEEIIAFFRHYKNTGPAIGNKIVRLVARVLCILIPCVFIVYYSHGVRLSEKYFGKWKVETMTRNGKIVPENAWEKDTAAWKVVYFEERGKLYYSPNPNMFVDSTAVAMRYLYDDTKNSLDVISYQGSTPDTIPVQINKFNGTTMQWNMILNKDTLQMQLKKVNE